jgi:GTP diphosphokinase / guanosine-3',5'-bis(diphosphate) 3'-diphosphatase
MEGKDPNLVIAALLHDAIEDGEVPYDLIEGAFGTDVADLVMEVTDDKRLPKEQRKKIQVETAPKKHRKQRSSSSPIKPVTCARSS